jgi:hypothetical protein
MTLRRETCRTEQLAMIYWETPRRRRWWLLWLA